ncbi:hypothetical protein BO82DRAFT_41639 [Aspergillus uvarum CBS 121591]|uniref:Uncharacterized protein n=1 Tax=Aspergillus uvarum CBS 121591 TaxID=1448315 RepID=A0A319CCU8_9EURO|nr:hypothetical protein BO82DRAFT_41639 [Aspergillus uvarum CBS 121591]PYH83465.1 hypothetical protein BO82DRAFT_41639 [Aspergillus uvarum CBS 121591]
MNKEQITATRRTGTRAKATENFFAHGATHQPLQARSTTRLRDCPEFELPTMGGGIWDGHTVWQTIINNHLREYMYRNIVIRSVCTCTLGNGGCGFQWHGNCHCRSRARSLGTKTPIFGFIDDWDSGVIPQVLCSTVPTHTIWILINMIHFQFCPLDSIWLLVR